MINLLTADKKPVFFLFLVDIDDNDGRVPPLLLGSKSNTKKKHKFQIDK
jgi:hypothetical protein